MRYILFALMIPLIAGCSSNEVSGDDGDIRFYTDDKTGCEYIIYHQVQGVAIYPRMDSEGNQVCGN